jgi:uncharacterized protein (DUF697 family)
MNVALISKVIKVVGSLLALYGVEVSPEQTNTIVEAVLIGYAILSAVEAKVKASK